jgi:hypothetical protein
MSVEAGAAVWRGGGETFGRAERRGQRPAPSAEFTLMKKPREVLRKTLLRKKKAA